MIEMLNTAGTWWWDLFIPAVVQNTLFLGLIFFVLHLLRSAPARVRYIAALAGMVKLLTPPFLRIPSILTIPVSSPEVYSGPIPFMTGSTDRAAAVPTDLSGSGISLAGALLAIWAAVFLGRLAISAFSSLKLALRLRGAKELNAENLPGIYDLGSVTVLRSEKIAMPLTFALLPRRIYVPAAWDTWSPECRRMVLLHELAHLRRRDGLFLIMQIIVRAIYFFHPLVAALERRLSEYREMACDDATVGLDRNSGMEYSRYLVEIAESVVRCPAVCGSASALIRRRNELLTRISYQLEEGRMSSISKTRTVLLAVSTTLLALSLSWYRGGASEGADYPSPPPAKQEGAGDLSRVNVLLKSDGVWIDEKATGWDELRGSLDIAGGGDPEDIVINLVCEGDVKMNDIRIFQETLLKMGISKINYVNGDGVGLPLSLPPPKAMETLEKLPDDLIVDVSISSNGGISVDGRKIDAGRLRGVIEERISETPATVVEIRNERATSYADFTRVLALVKEAGAERVVVRFAEAE
jgi:beta-lactamase regulating signal transducer with metallopeptidase domain/biopolymer transport protein ExbD